MQFVLILAVMTALVIAENSPAQPVSGALIRLAMAGCGVAIVVGFAAISSGVIARRLRSDVRRRHLLLERFKRLRRFHAGLWLIVAGATAYWLGWGQLVRFNWHLDHAFLLDDILVLAPVLLPLVLSWAAFYEVDRAILAGRTGEGSLQARAPSRLRYIGLHARHYLGLLLLPVLGLLAVQDAAELLLPGVLQSDYAALIHVPPLLLLFLLLPLLLRSVWKTQPLPGGPLRDRLESCARRAGFRAREILVWHTDGMMVNAAVAGFLPRLRYVFLTDGLLETLTDEEIEAVFGHEIGHVKHRHLSLRVMAMIAPLSLWFLLAQMFPQTGNYLQFWLGEGGIATGGRLGLLALACMAAYALVVFGLFSRVLECQADLFACRRLAANWPDESLDTFISALEKLSAANGGNRKAGGWQHASIARRINFLNRLARDPKRELRFQGQVRLLGILVVGIVFSPLAYRLLLG